MSDKNDTTKYLLNHDTNTRPQNGHSKINDSPVILDFDSLMPLPIQVGGHGKGDGHRAFLKHENGQLLKPKQPSPRGEREVEFYTNIRDSQDPQDVEIRKVIPEYYGLAKTTVSNGVSVVEDFLILQDACEGFVLPSVMDVKIGSRTWGPDATAKKRAQEDVKYPGTKHPFGFSVSGMIKHSLSPNDIGNDDGLGTRHGKEFGRTLKTEDVNDIPRMFFDTENSGIIHDLFNITISKMRTVLKAFENQTKYHIYASSLLLVYDADAVRKFRKGDVTKEDLINFVNVKVIDFAHVFPSDGDKDENFLRGLRNLIKLFEDFKSLDSS